MTDSASIQLPPRRVAVQIRHREPAGYRFRLGERAGDSNSLNTLTGSAFSICYNLPAPCFQSTAVSPENLGSVVAAVPPFGMRRLAARTLERSGPNTVSARALAAAFISLCGGHRWLISNFSRSIMAAGKPAFLPLVHDANQSASGFFKSFKVSKVLSFPAAVHDVNLAAEPKSVRQ